MEHRLIPDEHLHEVKGAKNAKAGQVLISKGDGTTEFGDMKGTSSLGFGLSLDEEGSIQLGKTLEDGYEITHVIDLDELGDDKLFAIGREFDQHGILTKGLMMLKDATGIREGNARIMVRRGGQTLEQGRSYSEEEVRMMCTINLDSLNTAVLVGDGREFNIVLMEGGMGKSKVRVGDNMYLYDQDYSKGDGESEFNHKAKVVNLGKLDEVVGDIDSVLGEVLGE